jgi:hypothetical protein
MGCFHSVSVKNRGKSRDVSSASPTLIFHKHLLSQSVQFNIVTDTKSRVPLTKQSMVLLCPPGDEILTIDPNSMSPQRGRASACSYRSYMTYDELAPDSLSVDHLSLISTDQLSEVFERNIAMCRYDLSHVSMREIPIDESSRKQNVYNFTGKSSYDDFASPLCLSVGLVFYFRF